MHPFVYLLPLILQIVRQGLPFEGLGLERVDMSVQAQVPVVLCLLQLALPTLVECVVDSDVASGSHTWPRGTHATAWARTLSRRTVVGLMLFEDWSIFEALS